MPEVVTTAAVAVARPVAMRLMAKVLTADEAQRLAGHALPGRGRPWNNLGWQRRRLAKHLRHEDVAAAVRGAVEHREDLSPEDVDQINVVLFGESSLGSGKGAARQVARRLVDGYLEVMEPGLALAALDRRQEARDENLHDRFDQLDEGGRLRRAEALLLRVPKHVRDDLRRPLAADPGAVVWVLDLVVGSEAGASATVRELAAAPPARAATSGSALEALALLARSVGAHDHAVTCMVQAVGVGIRDAAGARAWAAWLRLVASDDTGGDDASIAARAVRAVTVLSPADDGRPAVALRAFADGDTARAAALLGSWEPTAARDLTVKAVGLAVAYLDGPDADVDAALRAVEDRLAAGFAPSLAVLAAELHHQQLALGRAPMRSRLGPAGWSWRPWRGTRSAAGTRRWRSEPSACSGS